MGCQSTGMDQCTPPQRNVVHYHALWYGAMNALFFLAVLIYCALTCVAVTFVIPAIKVNLIVSAVVTTAAI